MTLVVRNPSSRASKCICHLPRTPWVCFVLLWCLIPGGCIFVAWCYRDVTRGYLRHFALIGSWITDSGENPVLFGYINHWPKVRNVNHWFSADILRLSSNQYYSLMVNFLTALSGIDAWLRSKWLKPATYFVPGSSIESIYLQNGVCRAAESGRQFIYYFFKYFRCLCCLVHDITSPLRIPPDILYRTAFLFSHEVAA